MGTVWKNRIIGYEEVAPGDIVENPRNWRAHPKYQQDALAGVLREIGIVQSVIISKKSGFLIDGHLRVALAVRDKQDALPVVYVDLDEAEEALVLATLDPIGALAAADKEKLDELLREVTTGEASVQELLSSLASIDVSDIEFKEFDESIEHDVEYLECPQCGHKWPK